VTHFSEGRESVTDEERSGRPAMSRTEENIAKVRQIVHENRWLTIRSIAEQANINSETVRKILTEDLDMRKVCALYRVIITNNWKFSILYRLTTFSGIFLSYTA
jgi:ribosomal protein S25